MCGVDPAKHPTICPQQEPKHHILSTILSPSFVTVTHRQTLTLLFCPPTFSSTPTIGNPMQAFLNYIKRPEVAKRAFRLLHIKDD
jgi:hypothetical protein